MNISEVGRSINKISPRFKEIYGSITTRGLQQSVGNVYSPGWSARQSHTENKREETWRGSVPGSPQSSLEMAAPLSA